MNSTRHTAMARHFTGWQCRIRQIAMRDHGGVPLPGMRPTVSLASGEASSSAITVLLVPADPEPAAAFLRFQLQRTQETQRAMEAGITYLGADFYQLPELFTGDLTAVFGEASVLARALLKAGSVRLAFAQYAQSFDLPCKVSHLPQGDAARTLSLCHNRLFNPSLPNTAGVLLFQPDWKRATADPMP